MPKKDGSPQAIVVRGARQHNLKDIDLELPRHCLIVITGVSGSGKSSLAFDVLYAEGQRRYVESLSSQARRYLQRFDAPLVDEIRGLSPAVAIEQKGLARNPRSTVATLTEIYDYLRLLYARLGVMHCPRCRLPVRAYTVPRMVEETLKWPPKSRLLVLAPLGRLEPRELSARVKGLRKEGFVRVRLDGEVWELERLLSVPPRGVGAPRVDVVVDRVLLDPSKTLRLAEALELAAALAGGRAGVAEVGGEECFFDEAFRCGSCGREMTEPSPSLFSFSHPAGACSLCDGLGIVRAHEGEAKDAAKGRAETGEDADWAVCPQCLGARINEEAQSVLLGGMSIDQVCRLSPQELEQWLARLDLGLSDEAVARRPVQEIRQRLRNLRRMGMSYMTLERSADTLSGGEGQRIRLAQQISKPLSGVLYVLDEPSVGLHPHEQQQLMDILLELRDAGNTVVVVEHDARTILQADHVVDMGPGAGSRGGEVVFAGSPQRLLEHPSSLTGRYLSGRQSVSPPSAPKATKGRGRLTVSGARGHNLKNLDVSFPLECLTCVTGPSGSGKSTLVVDTLCKALSRKLHGSRKRPAELDAIEGAEALENVLHIDQAPLGRTSRSAPATYMGVFSLIRQVYARLPEARARGYDAGRFSFNVKGGRCETCKGEGVQRVEMAFLPDVHVTCPDCAGTRYNRDVLEVRFKGQSIAETLGMTVHQACGFFENISVIRKKLEVLQEVGLGYLRLGQGAPTLSGGEAQRVKLARELARKTAGKSLYVFDEPTTGLHSDDIHKLLQVLRRLVDSGHTVIIIEHHLDVIWAADHVVDLGPEGGRKGGYVVASGTPAQVARVEASVTGRYLKEGACRE